ncbi:CIC11C00000004223 [Sungouiella intermedia]|uniref:CIC11C00000004223 n=1 Tax=Sungouiella intermedia TaxID=45354 RepID=A0A1L0DKZ4_9ASCO|nr:CIC11C00000004223 [[Candida] intermedia]
MPKNTLYVTGFTKESKAADLAPDFEKYGELVRLDIPPPRTDDGEKYAFVEYKNPEDCEKALELDGKQLPYAMKDGLVVQLARSDPYSARRGYRNGPRYRRGGYGGRGGGAAPGYGYGGPYPPPRGRGGYGYPGYGYERGGYGGGGYGGAYPARPGREPYYGGYGGPYGREAYGYRGYDDYRAGPDDRDPGYDPRDRYHNTGRRDGSDRNYENGGRPADAYPREGPREEGHDGERGERGDRGDREEYGRGRFSRSASPKRERSRSRSPSR